MSKADDIMSEPGEQLRANCCEASHDLAKASSLWKEANSWPDMNVLNYVVEHFMTELWDWNFSQTEIKEAFTEALAGMNHYAAGQERRC